MQRHQLRTSCDQVQSLCCPHSIFPRSYLSEGVMFQNQKVRGTSYNADDRGESSPAWRWQSCVEVPLYSCDFGATFVVNLGSSKQRLRRACSVSACPKCLAPCVFQQAAAVVPQVRDVSKILLSNGRKLSRSTGYVSSAKQTLVIITIFH